MTGNHGFQAAVRRRLRDASGPPFDGGGQRRGIDALGIDDAHRREAGCRGEIGAAEVCRPRRWRRQDGVGRRRRSRVLPAGDFEAALEQQPRQRGAIGRTHPGRAASPLQHDTGSAGVGDAHARWLRDGDVAGAAGRGRAGRSMTASAGSTRMFQMRTRRPAAAHRLRQTAISPRADSTRRSSAAPRPASSRRRSSPCAAISHRSGTASNSTLASERPFSTAALTSGGTTFAYAQWQ